MYACAINLQSKRKGGGKGGEETETEEGDWGGKKRAQPRSQGLVGIFQNGCYPSFMPADLDHSSYSVPNICRNMKVVFFPYHRLHWEEGLLIGFQRHVGGVDCQVILSSLKPDAELVDNLCEKLRECLYHEHVLQGNIWKSAVLGVWINEKLQQDSVEVLQNKIDRLIGDMSGYKHDLNLVGFAFDEASHVSFLTSERSWSKDKIVCVLYRIPEGSCTDSTEVSFSDEFSFSDGVSLQRFVQECELRLQTGRRTEMVEKCSYTGELLQLVNLVKQSRITTPELTSQIPCRRPVMHFLTVLFFPLSILCKLFLVACHGTCTFLDWLQECSFPKQAFVQFIIQLPVTNQQLLFRLRQLDALYKCCANGGHTNTDIEQDSSSSSGRSKEVPADISTKGLHRKLTQDIRIPQGNVVLGLLLDIVLGFVVVYWLDVNIHSTAVSDFIVDYTEMVVSLLSKLINWMVGAPAGLKLNRELAQFLGKFFHYHIYLWRSYLALIQPYISIIVWYGILSGCLGVTFLFSLASDMLSLVTIHIYCFYAYAARLYSLEIYGLIALARLFTGL